VLVRDGVNKGVTSDEAEETRVRQRGLPAGGEVTEPGGSILRGRADGRGGLAARAEMMEGDARDYGRFSAVADAAR
jgi:hypothetical protein